MARGLQQKPANGYTVPISQLISKFVMSIPGLTEYFWDRRNYCSYKNPAISLERIFISCDSPFN
jgi:hypothetical protein